MENSTKYQLFIPSWEMDNNHIVFNISTMPSDGETFTTKRRYREFERLNRKLQSNGLPKLALPGKLIMHGDSAIEQRRGKLERALKNYVELNGISPLLEEFLSSRTDPLLHSSRTSSVQESIIDDSLISVRDADAQETLDVGDNYGVKSGVNGEQRRESVASTDQMLPNPESNGEEVTCSILEYQTWTMELLAARANHRAQCELSLRLARIYTLATVATLAGSLTSKSNKWPLLGVAMGSALSAGIAFLNIIILKRKDGWRRRGFGLVTSPNQVTDAADVRTLVKLLEERRSMNSTVQCSVSSEEISSGEVSSSIEESTLQQEQPSPVNNNVQRDAIDESILNKIDDLHLKNQHEDIVLIIKSTFPSELSNSNIAWRWARAVYYTSMTAENEEAKSTLHEVLENLHAAVREHDNNSLVHKWIAIISNSYAEKKGAIRDRVEAGIAFEVHTKKAIKIDPNDATLHYMLGRFSFDVSGLTWLERQGAKAIAGKEPPKATYLDALKHYQSALSLRQSPAFLLGIGRCYQKLKNDVKALEYYQLAAKFTSTEHLSLEEQSSIEQAKELASKLKA